MTTILLVAIPIAMLVSAIVGGFLYLKRNLDTEIQSLAEGCRIIEEMLSNSNSLNVAEAQTHLALASAHLTTARALRDAGEKDAGLDEVAAGFQELKAARELVQRPEPEEDTE